MQELTPKELLKIVKNGQWGTAEEFKGFLSTLPPSVDSRTLEQMLDFICSKRLAADLRAHERRIAVFTKLSADVEDKALFGVLIKALKIGDSAVRTAVASVIPKVNKYDEHPKLCALLKSKDKELRRTAAAVLREVGGKTVLRTVANMVEERDFEGRSEAIDLVVPMAGHHAVPILSSVLKIGNPAEKIKALAYLSDKRYMAKSISTALRTISTALEDPSSQVVSKAIASFSSMSSEDDYFEYIIPFVDSANLTFVQAAIRGLGRFSSPRVIVALERKLRAGPNAVRMEVLGCVEAIGNDDVLPVLVDALGHKDMAVRTRAGEVLTTLGKAKKIDVARTILWLLHSQNVNVRRMAVEVARSVKDPEGELWPKLLAFLRDEDWWVRERVRDALVEMAGLQLTPHMVALLNDPVDIVRRFAMDVLIQLGDKKALGALINTARDDEDWWTREKAVEAIAVLKDERAIPYIVDLMRRDFEMSFICLEALQKLDARDTAPYVAELLQSEDPDVRFAAIQCLGAFEAREYAPQMTQLLSDTNLRVAHAAQERLLYWQVDLSAALAETGDKATSFLDKMLMMVVESEGDDLMLTSNSRPHMKRMGKIVPLSSAVLSHEQVLALLMPLLSVAHREDLEKLRDADFSYEVKNTGARFRSNVFKQNNGYGAVFRTIKDEVPDLNVLGLPEVVKGFGDLKHGLVLVGGPTGSGKSTTLAALINYINTSYGKHVISLEDPIEVVHKSAKGLVNQREIGSHTGSFGSALRSTLRDDPDVILVGEMRDLTTISFAVGAAETGHLVFGTVHTVSADSSVDRLINSFPSNEQPQVRTTLAENLRAVTCQYLVKRADGPGRVLVAEVMLNNDAIANLIRQGKTYQIPSVVATSRDVGMQSMDSELMRLFRLGSISAEEAYMKANVKSDFEEIFQVKDPDKPIEGAGTRAALAESQVGSAIGGSSSSGKEVQ